jgi:hypothetical protein
MSKLTTVASRWTRNHGPTKYIGPRVRVSDDGAFGKSKRTLWVDWEDSLNPQEMHRLAAQQWLDKFNPGATAEGPSCGFDNDYYWTWRRRTVHGSAGV